MAGQTEFRRERGGLMAEVRTDQAGLLDIGEVAARTGLAPSALRFYEQRGLVAAAGRNGLRRTYRPDVFDRLALIACARQAGFGIAEIARLERMRASLRHAAVCTHQPLVECPEFKQAIRVGDG